MKPTSGKTAPSVLLSVLAFLAVGQAQEVYTPVPQMARTRNVSSDANSDVTITPGIGSVSVNYLDRKNQRITGAFNLDAPATLSGLSAGSFLNLNPAATFTARHTVTGAAAVLLSVYKDSSNTCNGSNNVACTVSSMSRSADTPVAFMTMDVQVKDSSG